MFINKPQASWGTDRPQVSSGSPTASFGSENRAVFTVNTIKAGGPELLYGVFLEKIRFLSNSSVANAQWILHGWSRSNLGQACSASWSCTPEKRRGDLRRPHGRSCARRDVPLIRCQAAGLRPRPSFPWTFLAVFPSHNLALIQRWKMD